MLALLFGCSLAQTLNTDATAISNAIAAGKEQVIGTSPDYWGSFPANPTSYSVADGTVLSFYYSTQHNVFQVPSQSDMQSCIFATGTE